MSDFFLDLAKNKNARSAVKMLGLPVPMPASLARERGRIGEFPLKDLDVVVSAASLDGALAAALPAAGANPFLTGSTDAWVGAGEAWGRPARHAEEATRPWGLVFDATNLATVDDLKELHSFFSPRVRGVAKSGRVVVLSRPPSEAGDIEGATVQRAVEGFVRSLARETGRTGITANLVEVATGSEGHLDETLRFVLSKRSAYVSGQVFRLSDRLSEPTNHGLAGATALVTGGARGIGKATARRLAEEGAHVLVLDRPADAGAASEVAREIGGTVVAVDITDPTAAEKIRAAAPNGIDVIVHNAGVTRDKTLARMDDARWDLTLSINLAAVLRVTEELDDALNDEARIVCLSSIAGVAGNVGQTNYSASKAGIIGYVSALQDTLIHRGIAVNAVAPGFIETRLTDAIPVATREVARRLCNLNQGGLPIDVAELITFLSSPGAAGLTGTTIRCCGGNLVGA